MARSLNMCHALNFHDIAVGPYSLSLQQETIPADLNVGFDPCKGKFSLIFIIMIN